MEAFCGKWRLDRDGCEGEREFYEAEGSIPDLEMIDIVTITITIHYHYHL